MYDNIGEKIKSLAKTIFILETIVTVSTGIYLTTSEDVAVEIAFLLMIGGPIIAWISSCLLYGFGELINKICNIESNTFNLELKSKAQNADFERTSKIESLRSQGLITEEEYQQAISKEQ